MTTSTLPSHTNLAAINKSSAKIATFLVRVVKPKLLSFTYTGKVDGQLKTGNSFQCFLVGTKGESYCLGIVKGSLAEQKKAEAKFKDGSPWKLTKAVFDNTAPAYVSSPIKVRVDMSKSALEECLAADEAIARWPVPPRTVAETSVINTTKATDLIGLVRDMSSTRTTKSNKAVCTVDLIDGSEAEAEKVAVISVAVFGAEKIEFIRENQTKPLAFFNLMAKYENGAVNINHWEDHDVVLAPTCTRTEYLEGKMASLFSISELST